jgi:hypothetical protein
VGVVGGSVKMCVCVCVCFCTFLRAWECSHQCVCVLVPAFVRESVCALVVVVVVGGGGGGGGVCVCVCVRACVFRGRVPRQNINTCAI